MSQDYLVLQLLLQRICEELSYKVQCLILFLRCFILDIPVILCILDILVLLYILICSWTGCSVVGLVCPKYPSSPVCLEFPSSFVYKHSS